MPPDRRSLHDDPHPHAYPSSSSANKVTPTDNNNNNNNNNNNTADGSNEAGPSSRRRISKACENCRVRRTKCAGGIPCTACIENALERSCYVREKARPNRLAYSARRARPSVADAELLIRPIEDRASVSSRNSPSRPLSRSPRYNPIADIELRAQKWCIDNGLPPNSLLFQDEDRMSQLPSTPLPTSPALLVNMEDNLMRHLILSRDAEKQGGIGRSQFVRLYNRYRSDPSSLSDDQRSVVFAVLCLAKHDTLQPNYATGNWDADEHGRPVGREDVTYFRLACACLAGVRDASVYAVLSLLCLVPFAQAHGGMSESRSLLRMMAWHVREMGLHRQDVVDQLEPGEVDPAIFPMFRYMDTFMAGLDDLQPFFANAESDVPFEIPPHVTPICQQTGSMFSRVLFDDFADPTLDIRSDGYVNVAESSWAPALEEVRREKGRGRVARVRLIWTELRYHWLRVLLYTTRSIPPSDPARSAQAIMLVTHSLTQMVYLHYELVTNNFLHPSWPQIRRLAIMSQLLVLCTAQGEISTPQAEELFGKVFKVLENHKIGWATATGRLEEGLRRAGIALGLNLETVFPPMRLPEHHLSAMSMPSDPSSSAGVLDPALSGLQNMGPPNIASQLGAHTLPQAQTQAHIQQQQPPEELWGMFPFDPMSLFLDDSLWGQSQGQNQLAGLSEQGQGQGQEQAQGMGEGQAQGQGGEMGMEGFDEATLNELLGIPIPNEVG